LLAGSERNYFPWKCLELRCNLCFLNKPSVLLCNQTGITDPDIVLKWEKWQHQDYTQRNLTAPISLQLPTGAPHENVGIPLLHAPEAPRLKKTWVKKEGPVQEYFKDFVSQMTEAFVHKQLDKLTSDIHRRTLYGIDEDSKRLGVHCNFSQDLAHAQAEQSMCEYFDIISSSLFIAIAHFWDPVTKKRECEGTKLTVVLYISSSTRSFWCMQQNNVCLLACQAGFSYLTILHIPITR